MYTKIIIYAAVAVALFGGGMFTNFKLTKAPICNCPEMPDIIIPEQKPCPPAIEVQSLDLDKVRKIKGDFTFSPVYNGDVWMVTKEDTTKIK